MDGRESGFLRKTPGTLPPPFFIQVFSGNFK